MHLRAATGEVLLRSERNALRTAILSGDVQIDSNNKQPMLANAGSMLLYFSGKNQLNKIHAQQGVKLAQHSAPSSAGAPALVSDAQDIEITAPTMDFFVSDGRHLDRGQTSGDARIAILQGAGQRTLVTAGRFQAKFGVAAGRTQLVSLHGAPDAKVLTTVLGQPDRVSTSSTLDVAFRHAGGIDSILQQGNVAYVDGERKAWANTARYTPVDQMLVMTGSPRVVESGMTTTARTMRIHRATGDALAEGDVKSTYSQLTEQPNGALLASASPIHVTSHSMTARRSPARAVYTGNARLWQDANIVEAPTIEFDRDHRTITAQGTAAQPVSTVLIEMNNTQASKPQITNSTGKNRASKSTPVTITSARLTYTDNERRVHLEGGVVAQGADITINSNQMDAYLAPRKQSSATQAPGIQSSIASAAAQLDRIVAAGNVIIQQPSRRATGEKLIYTSAEDKFVLTGGPPSIFDAEHGKITGDSLTFYNRDDRVLVEGGNSSPTVTQTRVAR